MHNNPSKRYTLAICIVIAILLFFLCGFFITQIAKGDEYENAMNTVNTYTVTLEAARGEILDRNGDKLVENKQLNEIIFEAAAFPQDDAERNSLILSLINLTEEKNEEWLDELPLEIVNGKIQFKENSDSEIKNLKSVYYLNLNDYATAENCFTALKELYSLDGYDISDTLKIASVRYNMKRCEFSSRNPYVFASGVSTNLAAAILENSRNYPGVNISISTERQYPNSGLASHILGTVGVISSDEYYSAKTVLAEKLEDEELSEDEKTLLSRHSYLMNSDIGKSGIEQYCEEYLRGLSGEKTVTIDASGNSTEKLTVKPVTGDTVILTIDKELQSVCEEALEKRIKELGGIDGYNAAGAVVVLDVNNADVLACVSYPSFDLATYYEDYDELAADTTSPLWNRALQSTYAPGSTMKPVVALAGLETGVIDANSSFYCDEKFEYKGTTFSCLSAHGWMNVRSSLNHSCNIFYYNLADKLGISVIDSYASLFGLGSKTGVELQESSGVLASVEYREENGGVWRPGDTIQAAIGQSDNLFTPIQLANYCATIANGGTRYVPHLIKSILTSDYSETVYEQEATIAVETNINKNNLATVKNGMYDAANIGSCAETFSILSSKVACKTGTSQVYKKLGDSYEKGNNGFIISFGPFDNPEIAIAVVIENIDSGAATAQVAADIYDYWFNRADTTDAAGTVGALIP